METKSFASSSSALILKRRYWDLSGLPLVKTTMEATVKRPVQGGDVEALYAHGRGVQRKRALELEQGLVGAVVGIAGAHHVAHEGVTRVGGSHVKKTLLLAALRAVEAAEVPALLREPALQDLRVGEVAGETDLGGDVGRLVVVALEEAALELLLPHVQALVEDELHGADDADPRAPRRRRRR